eukprot:gb/GEZJ01004430.1/.p1 GENE.gb/GEZJ01004430.1/~~gb/GEZJ01004430.1/.p1  ORF type:complete len:179 (-),score=12.87 gb/GEZJ01004430.1/:295-831(-)
MASVTRVSCMLLVVLSLAFIPLSIAYENNIYDIICADEGCFSDCGGRVFCTHHSLWHVRDNRFTSFLKAYPIYRREFGNSRAGIKLHVFQQYHISSFVVNFTALNIYGSPERSMLTSKERALLRANPYIGNPYCIMELRNNHTGVCRIEPGEQPAIMSFPWMTLCRGTNADITRKKRC